MNVSVLTKRALVRMIELRRAMFVQLKTKRIIHKLDKKCVKEALDTQHSDRLASLGHHVNKELMAAYAVLSGIESSDYIPEDIYYSRIEPVLNNRLYALAYADKNFYERYLPSFKDVFPDVLFRSMADVLWDKNYNRINRTECLDLIKNVSGHFIAKPSTETSGGSNVLLMEVTPTGIRIGNATFESNLFDILAIKLGPNYIVQYRIQQHDWFGEINPSSLNTIRLMTYRSVSDEVVVPISAVLRFGKANSLVDNQASGGKTCGILDKGVLNDHTVDKYGRVQSDWLWLSSKKGTQVPGFARMCELSRLIAPCFPYHRLLGFDFCVDKSGDVKLIEINFKNLEVNFLQMNNGPLFGSHTEEVISHCRTGRRSYMIGYYAE